MTLKYILEEDNLNLFVFKTRRDAQRALGVYCKKSGKYFKYSVRGDVSKNKMKFAIQPISPTGAFRMLAPRICSSIIRIIQLV